MVSFYLTIYKAKHKNGKEPKKHISIILKVIKRIFVHKSVKNKKSSLTYKLSNINKIKM